MSNIQFFFHGVEYTNRNELAKKYSFMSHNRLQRILERADIVKVEYHKKYYFEKASTEAYIEGRCAGGSILAALEAGAPADADFFA